jgi:hypothetical protein
MDITLHDHVIDRAANCQKKRLVILSAIEQHAYQLLNNTLSVSN